MTKKLDLKAPPFSISSPILIPLMIMSSVLIYILAMTSVLITCFVSSAPSPMPPLKWVAIDRSHVSFTSPGCSSPLYYKRTCPSLLKTYLVSEGDSCWSVSQKYPSISWKTFYNNNQDACSTNFLSPGVSILCVPDEPVGSPPTCTNSSQVLYTIEKGDSCYSIATQFDQDWITFYNKNIDVCNDSFVEGQMVCFTFK